MVLHTMKSPPIYSKVSYPDSVGLMGQELGNSTEYNRNQNTLFLQIVSYYQFNSLYTDEIHQIIKSKIVYDLFTDGEISLEELYSPFLDSMTRLISELNRQERQTGIPETTNLSPLLFDDLLDEHLRPIKKFFDAG